MKIFLKQLLIFLLLYIGVRILVLQFLPYHWGNPYVSSKIQFMDENNEKPDMVIFGSSRVHRQIDPSLFDSLMFVKTQKPFSSFNLGSPATFAPQTYYLLEQFIKSDISFRTRFIILELDEMPVMASRHQERTSYWVQLQHLTLVIKSYLGRKDVKSLQKLIIIGSYIEPFVERFFGIGHFGKQIRDKEYYSIKNVGSKMKGFVPLDEEDQTEGRLKKTQMNDQKKLDIRYQNAINAKYDPKLVDRVHLNFLKELKRKANARNIEVIFLLSPRNMNSYIVTMGEELKKNGKVIDLSRNPNYYDLQLSYDEGHLNAKGSTLYTNELFEKCLPFLQP